MKNFAQVSADFKKREEIRLAVLGNGKQKAFEVCYSIPTPQGIREGFRFVKAQCPKTALATFRKQMTKSGQEFYEVSQVVSPNKRKGNVVYEVVSNKYILR